MFSFTQKGATRRVCVAINTRKSPANEHGLYDFTDAATVYYHDKPPAPAQTDATHNGDIALFPAPTDEVNQRDYIYVCGPSGQGKSTFMANYARLYHQFYPTRKIVLFGGKPKDEAYDSTPCVQRVPPAEWSTFSEDEDVMEKMKEHLIIFDDMKALTEKERAPLVELKNKLVLMGRSYKITVMYSAYIATDGHSTRADISNASMYVLFPAAARRPYMTLLTYHLEYDKEVAKDILSTDSRYVAVVRYRKPIIITQTDLAITDLENIK
jgi:energy-coupling factor transporter ATP-binding protein EcfA2